MPRSDPRGRPRALAVLAAVLAVLLAAALAAPRAHAGTLTRAQLQSLFPHPLMVGERDAQLPVWPVFKQEATATVLVAWLFESIDLAPLPGFAGVPVNLLVALDPKGAFLDVRVLSQHEPVFLDGLGEAPLHAFVGQYRGLSLTQGIRIVAPGARGGRGDGAAAAVDGVAKATASVRIVNQTLLAAGLQVARSKLGYAQGVDPARAGRVRDDVFRPLDWDGLVAAGLVRHVRITRDAAERAFAGSAGEGQGPPGPGPFVDLWVAYLNAPTAGRNLLGERGWKRLHDRLHDGDHALLVVGAGDYSFVGEAFVRGAVPERLTLRQGDLPLELRDMDLDAPLALPAALRGADAKVFRVIGQAGLDPSRPMQLALRVTRARGAIYPERASRDFALDYALPADHVVAGSDEPRAWQASWASRVPELAVLVAALALLSALLARPAWLVAEPRRLARFRLGFLLFTLVFVGWWAQGQLSIVNATALVQALVAGRSLDFFLYDPVSLVLWAFVAVTLLAWGRGTFCGWLCPFGALQELVHGLARRLGVPTLRLPARTDARLKRLKYLVLAAVIAAAAVSGPWADRLVEIEPFKTAITLGFVRAWPYLAWALAVLAASAVLYKGWCRYLCPLGAGVALLDPVRRFAWIARRAECGRPCQTCRHACAYQAIDADGRIRYDECFQCLECVGIHASVSRCAPLIARHRGRPVFALRPVATEPAGSAR
ncbi:MAG TPA: 4Fe-4S binding protein [Albitalea sp.]